MSASIEVLIVGAGPYGLSLAAHLHAHGVSSAIYGPPMEIWRDRMPRGMLLKSEGFASNLSDPGATFPLKRFCAERGLPYDDTRIPVPIETFIDYALAFQQELVPHLDHRRVTRIDRNAGQFLVQLEDGAIVHARRVVLAVGIAHYAYIPPLLEGLPPELLSHSSTHTDCARFAGQKVTIVGGGASAIDLAALMHESGVHVSVVARRSSIEFHKMPGPGPRPLLERLRRPSSGLGPGWKSRFYTDAPGLFRHFPQKHRHAIVRRHLGPAPGWPMKQRVMGKVPMLLERDIAAVERSNGGVRLTLRTAAGKIEEHHTGHVVAATGYRPDLRRLLFLGDGIENRVEHVHHTPVLSADFESSIPGLYFIGISSANQFGPMMRFAYGSDYTARKLDRHLRKQIRY